MNTESKRRIVFALLMGSVTTGIISFVLIALNIGFTKGFTVIWLRSWGIGYVFAIPAILLLGPKFQAIVNQLFPHT